MLDDLKRSFFMSVESNDDEKEEERAVRFFGHQPEKP